MTTAILFVLFCSLFLALSYLESRRAQTLDDFCLAGRSASGWSAGLSIAASSIGASATIGVCGLAFEAGFPAFWWLGAGAIGLALSAILLVDRIRAQRPVTLLGAIEESAGRPAAKLAAIVILAAWTGILAAQFSAMGRLFAAALGEWLPGGPAATALGAFFITGATLLGGQRAVLRSDVCQSAVMAAGLAALLLSLLFDPDAALLESSAIENFRFELWNDAFGPNEWFEFMLLIGGSYLICPMLSARFLAAATKRDAHVAAGVGIAGLLAGALVIVLIGLAARSFVASGTEPDAVLPALIETRSPVFGALFLFVMTSAVLSSADSCLMTSATVGAVDLAGRRGVRTIRRFAILLALAALAASLSGRGILSLLLTANALYVCGVVPVAFAALRASRPLHPVFAAAAVLSGSLLGAIGALDLFGRDYSLGFSAAGFAAAYLIARLGRTRDSRALFFTDRAARSSDPS